jgi:hypothetical protein
MPYPNPGIICPAKPSKNAELATFSPLAWYWSIESQTPTVMILKFFFSWLSIKMQVNYLKRRGITLGTRLKDGRRIYLYMLNNLFVEVFFKHDNVEEEPEKVKMISGLGNLTQYLERDFRSSF